MVLQRFFRFEDDGAAVAGVVGDWGGDDVRGEVLFVWVLADEAVARLQSFDSCGLLCGHDRSLLISRKGWVM